MILADVNIADFIPLITVGVILIAIVVAVLVIRHKIREISRKVFGTSSFLDGYTQKKRQLSETPRSVQSMTSIYLPQIHRDFPEFDYDLYKNKAESVLRGYFAAISTKNISALNKEEISNTLMNNVQGIIEELESLNQTQTFSENVIHNTQLARYDKDGMTVRLQFNAAVGQYVYIEDKDGKVVFGSKDLKHQTVYEIALVYIQDSDKMGYGEAMGLNCPNCGAPIKNLGQKFCDHCGSGVIEVNTRSWFFDSVTEQSVYKKAH